MRPLFGLIAATVVLAACVEEPLPADDDDGSSSSSGSGAAGAGTSTGSGAGGGSEPVCNGTQHDPTVSEWPLPSYGLDANGDGMFRYVAGDPYCPGGGRFRYQLVELDGDGLSDLVVTEHCDADLDTGASQWRVHLNQGAGFTAEPTMWALPSYGLDANGDGMFRYVASDPYCPGGGRFRYQLVELNGDDRPDLVVTEHCDADVETGSSQWRVHMGGDAGFAAEPTMWALPSYGLDANGDGMFRYVASDPYCPGGGRFRYQLVELNGDGKTDLVVTEHCDADMETGFSQWRVHLNEGAGFAAEPTYWTLPSYGRDANLDGMFRYVASDPYCPAGGRLRYQLADLDGDGMTDLVITEQCDADMDTGLAHWRLHPNQGSGFAAEPTYWTLPSYGRDTNLDAMFRYVASDPYCPGGGRLRYQLIDITADRKPDLLITKNCDADVDTGANQWLVHGNEGTGFAATPTPWGLPAYGLDANGDGMFRYVANDPYCPGGGRLRYQLVSIGTRGGADLLVTEQCDADTTTGVASWRLHPIMCSQ
jgi:hypothetical protein